MGAIFGSGKSNDGGQGEAARIQAKLQKEQMAADQARYEQERQDRIAREAADAKKLSDDEAKRKAEMDAMKLEQQKQAEAAKATNAAADFTSTRSDQAKQLANLPGFGMDDKYKRAQQNNNPNAGYLGQSNQIQSSNQPMFGGRKYV